MIYSSNLLRIKADGHKRPLGTLVDDRLHLPDAKSDKNAKNARFAVGSDAKSDKNGKNARFTLGLVDDSNRPGGPVVYAGKTQKHNHGSCQIIINNGTPL